MLKSPVVRQVIIGEIRWMAEANLGTVDPKAYDFDYLISMFFDDWQLDTPERQIGFALWDKTEADVIKRLTDAMDRLYRNVGSRAPNKEYLEDEAWPQVTEAARAALGMLKRDT